MMPELITDRTQADTVFAAANRDGAIPLKGAYNATDYNRVGAALNYLAEKLVEFGFLRGPELRTDWREDEPFSYQDASNYLAAVRWVRDAYYRARPAPPLPDDIHELFNVNGHEHANDIERSLIELEASLERVATAWFMSGEITSGEA